MNNYCFGFRVSFLLLFLAISPISFSSNEPVCETQNVGFGYFNGVGNLPSDAARSLGQFKDMYGDTFEETGDSIRYEPFYNHTENLFVDIGETFNQRFLQSEESLNNRWELFWSALSGGDQWSQKIEDLGGAFSGFSDDAKDYVSSALASKLLSLAGDPNPGTEVVLQEHRTRLDNWDVEGKKVLLVGHSQGNLFMNRAYDYLSSQVGPESLKTVHIAPASKDLNGPHTLADKDLVIQKLLNMAVSVPEVTTIIPSYLQRPPGPDGNTDIKGHGLLEIYLNRSLDTFGRISGHIESALQSMESRESQGEEGFFTATLTWDGSGDADLHVYEPNATHVYFSNKNGSSGYLDVDNTVSYGPEHYYATCEAGNLQKGNYQVGVANFSGADGRKATLQVSSYEDGPLGTRSVRLGASTGTNPSHLLFDVLVQEDQDGSGLEVTLQ